ncbi:fumble [Pisolithus croceorrhizus]|nr:fumble [Pisolithus croceorrhizus]
MPAPSLPSPRVIHVNTRGAVILAEESPETRDSRGIYLPNYIEPISHIAVDIGGSLAKVVYFTRSPEEPPSPSAAGPSDAASNSFLHAESTPLRSSPSSPRLQASHPYSRNGTLTPSVLESSLNNHNNGASRSDENGSHDERSAHDGEALDTELLRSTILKRTATVHHIPGGYINFERFETEHISSLISHGVKIMGTGGGAHKFGELFEKELKVEVVREEEMECLIAGMKFMAMIPEEVYYFSDELISELSHPGTGSPILERPSPNPPRYAVTFETGEPSAHLPCLLVNIGSGVSIIKVDADGTFERVSGTSLGGGTLWGLLSLLTPAKTFDWADNTAVDILVGDIYGTDYSKIGLKSNTIASSFGKVFKNRGEGEAAGERRSFKAEDISRSLLYAVSNNIGQIAYMNAEKYGLDRIYFGGYFIRGHSETIATLSYAIRFWSHGKKRALFFRHEGFLGAVGAWIKNIDVDEGGGALSQTPALESLRGSDP